MKRKIRSAMVNLHIGGAVSVFFICVGLLSCDYWFNRNEPNPAHLSEGNVKQLETSSEFVLAPPTQFFFTQQPNNTNAIEIGSDAVWLPSESWVEEPNSSWVEKIRPPKLTPDGKLYASGIENY